MSAKHFDGTLCVGGGFNPPQFENMGECPLCARDTADWATEHAALLAVAEAAESFRNHIRGGELNAALANLAAVREGGAK